MQIPGPWARLLSQSLLESDLEICAENISGYRCTLSFGNHYCTLYQSPNSLIVGILFYFCTYGVIKRKCPLNSYQIYVTSLWIRRLEMESVGWTQWGWWTTCLEKHLIPHQLEMTQWKAAHEFWVKWFPGITVKAHYPPTPQKKTLNQNKETRIWKMNIFHHRCYIPTNLTLEQCGGYEGQPSSTPSSQKPVYNFWQPWNWITNSLLFIKTLTNKIVN